MKPKPPVKLPRAYIESLYVDRDAVLVNSRAPDLVGDRLIHTACVPCRTRQEAREIVKVHSRAFEINVDYAVSAVLRASPANWRDMALRSIVSIALKDLLIP